MIGQENGPAVAPLERVAQRGRDLNDREVLANDREAEADNRESELDEREMRLVAAAAAIGERVGQLERNVAAADQAAVRADEWLQRVLRSLDATDDAVLMFDVDTLRYTYANAGASRLLGHSNSELLTMTPLQFLPGSTEEEYRRRFASVLGGAETSEIVQACIARSDGTEVFVEASYRFDGQRWMIVVVRDVTSRLAMEAELRDAEQRTVVAADRERIARDLQDKVVQSLFGHSCQLAVMLQSADDTDKPQISALVDGLAESMDELRSVIFYLHGAAASPGGLRSRLLVEAINAAPDLGLDPRVQFEGPVDWTDERIARQLIQAFREALDDIAEHGQARSVRVEVTIGDHVTMTVQHDGSGVTFREPTLTMLAERARNLGGQVLVDRGPELGSQLTWSVPIEHGREHTPPGAVESRGR